MWMVADQLEALAAVVREGSFDRAATSLSITTSAVSQRIKALEGSVGRVVVRRARPSTATGAGEVLLKLALQLELLEHDARRELGLGDIQAVTMPISVNSDSLRGWMLPALVDTAREHGFLLDVRREDEDVALRLLRNGEVMAAITSDPSPVQGCSVRPLGAVRYVPVASAEFASQWLPKGMTVAATLAAPTVVYDRDDRLLDRFLGDHLPGPATPPRSFVPGSWDYPRAIAMGLGWGIVPASSVDGLTVLSSTRHIDSALYWHQWGLPSVHLAALGDAVVAAARTSLRPIRRPER
jgi:LysR family transcriptional regulator (chromosome initiation inhibitor)